MNIVEIKKAVGRIKSNLFKNANSYSIGMLKSHFKGAGLQFKEHQVYVHGDDVRFIDWKIFAKTGCPYIKTFDEERNVEIVVVIDASLSMFSGYQNTSKLKASIEICCLLYLLAKETSDFVHTIIISDELIHIPKKNGDEGISLLVSCLEKHGILTSTGDVNLNYHASKVASETEKVASVMKHLAKKREIVLLSDFNEFLAPSTLRRMVYQSHVHCFQISSPLDEATTTPYTVFSKELSGEARGKMQKVNFGGAENIANILGKRVKKIKVEERYLETFIKEMM